MSLISVAAKFDPFAPVPDKVFTVPAGLTVAELVRRCDPPGWFEAAGFETPTLLNRRESNMCGHHLRAKRIR